MAGNEQKTDSGLRVAFDAWRKSPDPAQDAGIGINLSFQGSLADIEALGFETQSVFGDQAFGVVLFKDIPALDEHPGVLWMAAGQASKPFLDTAMRDVRARATAPVTGAPVDGLWHADVATGALTHAPKATGKGVIIAIMDTGIDFTHPMFLSSTTSPLKSRILFIWDQHAIPATVADCPPKHLLTGNTYGMEFTQKQIEDHLNGVAAIEHRDCGGHGTHVAGIAAGGPHFSPVFGDAKFVGAAPEADIIAVKYLDVRDQVLTRKPDGSLGNFVDWAQRFADGVLYCLRRARELGKPIVINMSFGGDANPGDALDENARLVDKLLDPSQPEDDTHFPKGAIIVKAAGNERGQVTRIVVPASGQAIVPLILVDFRKGSQTTWQRCTQERYKPTISAHFWYRRPAAPLAVTFSVQFPFGAIFSAEVAAGSAAGTILQLGLDPVTGPPRRDDFVAFADDSYGVTIEHKAVGAVPHPAGGTVQRSYCSISLEPKDKAGTISYHAGIYRVRIIAPPGTVLFHMGETPGWTGGRMAFRLTDEIADGTPAHDPAIITKTPDSLSVIDPLGKNAITVAAYSDEPNATFSLPSGIIWSGSSRGPIRDYSDPPRPPWCDKPDIAAPGENLNSAMSRHTEGWLHWPWWYLGDRFDSMDGTSMATPVIGGIVALMLEKKPNLSVDDVRTALRLGARPGINPTAVPAAADAFGAGMVDAMVSHDKA